MTIELLTKKVEEAMNGFETFKTDLAPKLQKMDAFDQAKFDKIEKSVGDAIELSQKNTARLELAEKENAELKTALNRAPAAGSEPDEKVIRAKQKKLFNDFARSSDDESKQYFHNYIKKNVKDEAELKSLSAGSDPAGGYTVLPQLGGIIQEFVYETSPIRQLATVTTIGTDSYEVILDNDQAAAGWVGESDTRSATATPTFGKLEFPVNEIYANAAATQKILDDSMIDMEAWLGQKVGDVFARKEATAFVAGTGVAQPKGLLSYTSGTDTTQQQVEQINSGDASNFTFDGIVNLQTALKEPYQANATFLIKRASVANLMLIKDGIGHPLLNLMIDKNVGLEPTIMGRPVRFASDMPSVGSNNLAMIYGDIRRAYQIVDRSGIRVLRDPFTSKPNVIFYTTKRVGGGVKNFEAFKIQKISA
jgi:HK97 family phage major capsid protein